MTVTSPSRKKNQRNKKQSIRQSKENKKRSKFQVFDSFPSSNWRRTDLASIIRPWKRRRLCTSSANPKSAHPLHLAISWSRGETSWVARKRKQKHKTHGIFFLFCFVCLKRKTVTTKEPKKEGEIIFCFPFFCRPLKTRFYVVYKYKSEFYVVCLHFDRGVFYADFFSSSRIMLSMLLGDVWGLER